MAATNLSTNWVDPTKLTLIATNVGITNKMIRHSDANIFGYEYGKLACLNTRFLVFTQDKYATTEQHGQVKW